MSFAHGHDLCLTFWADVWDQQVIDFPQNAQVLEIGSGEADWITPMLILRPDLQITGIDCRPVKRRVPIIQANVVGYAFPEASFDAIVAVSTLEHIGLGSYQDPHDRDGDSKTFAQCARWLKPGGWLYADVPYRPGGPYVITGNYRAYDPEAYGVRFHHPALKQDWSKLYEPDHRDGPFLASVWRKR